MSGHYFSWPLQHTARTPVLDSVSPNPKLFDVRPPPALVSSDFWFLTKLDSTQLLLCQRVMETTWLKVPSIISSTGALDYSRFPTIDSRETIPRACFIKDIATHRLASKRLRQKFKKTSLLPENNSEATVVFKNCPRQWVYANNPRVGAVSLRVAGNYPHFQWSSPGNVIFAGPPSNSWVINSHLWWL